MNRSSAAQSVKPLGHLARLSRIGAWVSAIALLLGIGSQIYALHGAINGTPSYVLLLLAELGITYEVGPMSTAQLLLISLLWISADILGMVFLLQVHQLFRSFLGTQVFTTDVQRRMRSIGWIIFAMAPLSILTNCVAGMLISLWHTDSLQAMISVEGSDIYAITIGLVIASVSHIMLEASRLSDENQAFV